MKRLARIGILLKKIYRLYSLELLGELQKQGYTDLRPSFLELLSHVCENDGPTIKQIGVACGLKKQTMTSHLNELEKRNYIVRRMNHFDKREQKIYLTEYGEKFKVCLFSVKSELERKYAQMLGEEEMDQALTSLQGLFSIFSEPEKYTLPTSQPAVTEAFSTTAQ